MPGDIDEEATADQWGLLGRPLVCCVQGEAAVTDQPPVPAPLICTKSPRLAVVGRLKTVGVAPVAT